jgi:uncharacterized membrane protein
MTHKPVIVTGILLGIGLGGSLDGILFLHWLQLHSRGLETLLFHVFTWFAALVGLVKFWKAGKHPNASWSGKILSGSLVVGWGFFNIVEGVIDYIVPGVHPVVDRLGHVDYAYVFFASGLWLIIAGFLLIVHGMRKYLPPSSGAYITRLFRNTPKAG